jgi:hypothetical protein
MAAMIFSSPLPQFGQCLHVDVGLASVHLAVSCQLWDAESILPRGRSWRSRGVTSSIAAMWGLLVGSTSRSPRVMRNVLLKHTVHTRLPHLAG